MIKNNNGFTLIELLAIITVLSIILMITIVSVSTILTNSKDKLQETQQKQILKSAELYNNREGIYGFDTCVNVQTLTEKGYIKEDEVKDPKTGDILNGSVKIYYETNKYSYEYSDKKCLCRVVEEKISEDIGTKYSCEVKDGTNYNFYILSTENNKVNLMLEHDICENGELINYDSPCTYKWHAGINNNTYGPDTAMQVLYNATKNWTNIPDMILDYTDEFNSEYSDKGYLGMQTDLNTKVTKILLKNGTANSNTVGELDYPLKARLPKLSEVNSSNFPNGYPTWINENQIENKLDAYWLMSSGYQYNIPENALNAKIFGNSRTDYASTAAERIGIRPVINVDFADLSGN